MNSVLTRTLAALLLLGIVVNPSAAVPLPDNGPLLDPDNLEDLATLLRQDQAAAGRRFTALEQHLQALNQRLKRSDRAADKALQTVIHALLQTAEKEGMAARYERLARLVGSRALSLTEVKELRDQSDVLSNDLRALLVISMHGFDNLPEKEEGAELKQVVLWLIELERCQTQTGQDLRRCQRLMEEVFFGP